mgnify:FL=1
MICVHCGKEIQDNAAFCPYCGTAAKTPAPAETAPSPAETAPAESSPKPERSPRKMLAPAAFLVALLAGGLAFSQRKPTVNLNRYVTLSAEGYDTVGKLNVEFDTDKLEADYGKKIAQNFKKVMADNKQDTLGLSSAAAALYSGQETDLFAAYCATGSADKTSGLSNGDVVTYTWDDNQDAAKELFGVNIKCSDITYKVSGLQKVDFFDAFDGVTVEFNGTAPHGTAAVNCLPTAAAAESLTYTLDTTDGLKNGDTVTLTVRSDQDNFSDCIQKYGALPAAAEKTFTVQGLDEYVTSADKLSESALTALKAQAEDTLNAYAASHWDAGSEQLVGMDYLGNYLLTPKPDSTWTENNLITLVYKVNVHNNYKNYNDEVYEANNAYYWYITFKNVSVNSEGVISQGLSDYTTPDSRMEIDSGLKMYNFSDSTFCWNYVGYKTLDGLYKAAVTRNIETYNHQDNLLPDANA